MDKTYQKFLRSGIDLSPVGVERREDNNPYFCTPRVPLYLAGQAWTASTFALYEDLVVWSLLSVP